VDLLHILERNFRCRQDEVDLVAEDEQDLIFVEVKARRGVLYHFLIKTRVFLWDEATSERRYETGSDRESPVRRHSVELGCLRVHLGRENVG
jgi:hypothetical protein